MFFLSLYPSFWLGWGTYWLELDKPLWEPWAGEWRSSLVKLQNRRRWVPESSCSAGASPSLLKTRQPLAALPNPFFLSSLHSQVAETHQDMRLSLPRPAPSVSTLYRHVPQLNSCIFNPVLGSTSQKTQAVTGWIWEGVHRGGLWAWERNILTEGIFVQSSCGSRDQGS